ncbi:uncharacterized protein LOC135837484 [Planococcus citri]|uniref:uncharacterized protein LOC135837484 n=1 Tax=Planococcus citri TaxID=170843 RepID=UPI0031F82A10
MKSTHSYTKGTDMQKTQNCSTTFPTTNITNQAIREVFQLLAAGETILCTQPKVKDATLVLGNTGAGKSTFTRTIAGYESTLKSVPENLYYTIVNPDSESRNESFITSNTIFPEQVRDNNTGSVYYDFPGFQDTRGMAHDITTTYFIKKIVDSVERIRVLLLVNYTSFTNTGTRDDFTTLLSHITKFIKNIDKYKDGIALIATKAHLPTTSDDQIISAIATFIGNVKKSLEQADHSKMDNRVKLLDTLLQRDGNTYPKIAIFRSPDEAGYLSHIPSMQKNIKKIKSTLETLKFLEKTDSDFTYTIPKQSLIDVDNVIGEITRGFATSVREIGKEIQKNLSAEEDLIQDISKLYNVTSFRYDEITKIMEKAKNQQLENCAREVINGAISMNVNSIHHDMLMKYANYSSFLHNISDHIVHNKFQCADELQYVVEHSRGSKTWYHFLNKLYERLSDYETQTDTLNSPCTALAKNAVNGNNSEFNLDPFDLKKCYPNYESEFENIRNVKVNKSKLNALEKVLDSTLKSNSSYSCDSDKLVIKGEYVKLGDVPYIQKRECKASPKFIEIFALSKIFINADFNKIGEEVQLSIIAPVWHIQGTHKITLDGKSGDADRASKAPDGANSGDNGSDGLPGSPGGPAGNFIGIGETFKHPEELTISVRGGDGGRGQDGGNGRTGNDGEKAYNDITLEAPELEQLLTATGIYQFGIPKSNHKISEINVDKDFFTSKYVVVLDGHEGKPGGNGGNGGMGGPGGTSGEIIFASMTSSGKNETGLQKVTGMGSKGTDGEGGKGAEGGKHGNKLEVTIPLIFKGFRETTERVIETSERASQGHHGKHGYYTEGGKYPEPSRNITNLPDIVNEYKQFARGSLNRCVREFHLIEFLNKLENNTIFQNHHRKRRSINCTNGTQNINRGNSHIASSLQANAFETTSSNDHHGIDNNTLILKTQDTNKTDHIILDNAPLARSAGVRIHSPINFAINLVKSFFGQWKLFDMNHSLVKGGAEFRLREPEPAGKANLGDLTKFGNFNINESLTLIDFAIRCITKEKFFNNADKLIDLPEVKASVLSIMTQFEKILSDMSVQYNIPFGFLDFDPVTLMSKLENEVLNRNYKNVGQVLYECIESSPHLDDIQFHTHILHNLDKILQK